MDRTLCIQSGDVCLSLGQEVQATWRQVQVASTSFAGAPARPGLWASSGCRAWQLRRHAAADQKACLADFVAATRAPARPGRPPARPDRRFGPVRGDPDGRADCPQLLPCRHAHPPSPPSPTPTPAPPSRPGTRVPCGGGGGGGGGGQTACLAARKCRRPNLRRRGRPAQCGCGTLENNRATSLEPRPAGPAGPCAQLLAHV